MHLSGSRRSWRDGIVHYHGRPVGKPVLAGRDDEITRLEPLPDLDHAAGSTTGLDENLMVFIPSGRAINPITDTNWEGVGVKPHIEVAAEDALEVSKKKALEGLISVTDNEMHKGRLEKLLSDLETQMGQNQPKG